MKLRLKDSFGMVPVGQQTAASPLYLRKSSAFPADSSPESRGSAADLRHSLEEDEGGMATVKQSFTANRQAEPKRIR